MILFPDFLSSFSFPFPTFLNYSFTFFPFFLISFFPLLLVTYIFPFRPVPFALLDLFRITFRDSAVLSMLTQQNNNTFFFVLSPTPPAPTSAPPKAGRRNPFRQLLFLKSKFPEITFLSFFPYLTL